MKRWMFLALSLVFALAALSGCTSDGSKSASGDIITFADCGWDSLRLQNAIARRIAEDAFGYQTEEVSVSTAVMITGMEGGDIDVNIEVWSDQIEAYDDFVASGKVQVLATNFDDSEQGLYVPRYLIEGDDARGIEPLAPNLRTVEDLAGYADLFPDEDDPSKGRIYSYVVGSTTDAVVQAKVAHYGLDAMYNCFAPGSDTLLSTAIVSAYERGEPIVAYYWSPTWLLGKYDFVLLEDAPYDAATFYDGATAFPPCDVTIVAGNALVEEKPDFCEFLRKFTTNSALLNEAMAYMQDNEADVNETAVWFLNEHPEMLAQWLTPEQVEAVQANLQ
ncbi:MAG: ABC transporter substrate-binding protein [Christensenellales bacterium]